MRIYSTRSVKEIDALTMRYEPIDSFALMKRAAGVLVDALLHDYGNYGRFVVFAGPGNNGGDGIVMARMLLSRGYAVEVWLASDERLSDDCATALEKLRAAYPLCPIGVLTDAVPDVPSDSVIIDALFGSGLCRPLDGRFAQMVQMMNSLDAPVVSVDIPSGLMGEDNGDPKEGRAVVCAERTYTLQFPKLSMFFAENEKYIGKVRVLDIGLSKRAMDETEALTHTIEQDWVCALISPRSRCAHKGCFGRALLVAGSQGMAGASVLAARAAMRSGLGLLTVHLPVCNNEIVQSSVPEAMTSIDACDTCFSVAPNTAVYTAIGVGPGLGRSDDTAVALHALIKNSSVPMVVDADALNIFAQNPTWIDELPSGSVLTPHPGELARLVGESYSGYRALTRARDFAIKHNVCVVLKGGYTAVIDSNGDFCINTAGNAGMATGGSGDVLTGVVLALLARGYSAYDAARIAVYVHSVAGDEAARELGETSLMAGDIVRHLPDVWRMVERV
ncbi:MAG: NAD(P)H-hydrate dehydratase [Bacteroidaceae bacterium]|nr:NAD(P)H-hydrate dehydratase [Bacteroidaceae bacterium]